MSKNRPYQARSVKQIEIAEITRDRDGMGCDLGLDTSKAELLVCLRWKNGSFERPWRVPLAETPLLIEKLRELQQGRERDLSRL